jgi:hypothetical protein
VIWCVSVLTVIVQFTGCAATSVQTVALDYGVKCQKAAARDTLSTASIMLCFDKSGDVVATQSGAPYALLNSPWNLALMGVGIPLLAAEVLK